MTSIEILEKIIKRNEEIYRFGSSSILLTNDEWNVIYKDLKVLEFLKKNSQYGEYYLSCDKNGKLADGYLEIKVVIPDTKKQEFNDIKEWLENA